jgi:hypothetical protein
VVRRLAEFGRDRIRTSWDDAQRRAVAGGVHGASHAPGGYTKGADGRLRRKPRTAPAIARAFHLRARGSELADVSRDLRDQRVRSQPG